MNTAYDRPKLAVWDIDNCLANDEWRIQFINWGASDPDLRYGPYHERCGEDQAEHQAIFRAVSTFARPVFITARPENVRDVTTAWLKLNFGVLDPHLIMRGIGDHRPSRMMKHQAIVSLPALPVIAFDDRQDVVDMYKGLGIPAQVLAVHDTCAMTPPASAMVHGGHLLWQTGDHCCPREICDSNGEVTLSLCRWCGKGEAELDAPCSGDPMKGFDSTAPRLSEFADAAQDVLRARAAGIELNPVTRSLNGQMQDYTRWSELQQFDPTLAAEAPKVPHSCPRCQPERYGERQVHGGVEFWPLKDQMPDAPPSRGTGPSPRPAAKRAPDYLEEAAATFRERNAVYGDNYREFGAMAAALFPRGLAVQTAEDWNRLAIFIWVLTKVSRYAQNIEDGGHPDSALDLTTYAAMLREMTA